MKEEELKEIHVFCPPKYKNVNSLSRELIDSLVDNIYIYEDKKIKIKFKYEDEYNYLMDFIKRRKNFLS